MKERKIEVERDIRKIEKYILVLENKDDPLNVIFERIANSLLSLDKQKVTDDVLMGLVEMLSISLNFSKMENSYMAPFLDKY